MSDALRDAGRLLAYGVAPDGLLAMLSAEQRAALARRALGVDLEQAIQPLRHLATALRRGLYEQPPSAVDPRRHNWFYEVETKYGPASPQIEALKALILVLTSGQSAAPHEGDQAAPIQVTCMECGVDSGQQVFRPLKWRCSSCVRTRSTTPRNPDYATQFADQARQFAWLRASRHQAGLCLDCGGERDVEGNCLTGACTNKP